MVQPSAEALDSVVQQLLVASRSLVAVAARSLADVDVTLPQWRALVVLAVRDTTTVSDLAAALAVHPTTATRLTDRLVRKRLVRRTEMSEDRRMTQLQLAAGGRHLVQRVTARRVSDLEEIVGRIPPDRWAAVIDALRAFSEAAGETHPIDRFGWAAPAP